MSSSLEYRSDIDGLRAIAVTSVLCYHLGLNVTGGYVGVDVFFVISGYLITSIILKSIRSGAFSFVSFMERRIRRIYPPMLLVVAATLIVAYQLQLPFDFQQTAYSAIAQMLSVANVFFYFETGGYFGAEGEIMPLLHTWSLSVEEQFYLIVPLLLLTLYKFANNRIGIYFFLAVFCSFLLSVAGLQYFKTATFYLLPMRAWELGIGALIPVLGLTNATNKIKPVNEIISIAGMIAICYAIFWYDSDTPFPGHNALIPCVGTMAVIWSNQTRNTIVYRVLSNKLFVGIGLVSYSVYLWHWPLIAYANYIFIDLGNNLVKLTIASLSILLGYLTWILVEQPIRRAKLMTRFTVYKYWAVSTLAVVFLALFIVKTDGLSHRFPPEVISLADTSHKSKPGVRTSLREAMNGNFLDMGEKKSSQVAQVFFWGDSHAQAIFDSFDDFLLNKHIVGKAAISPGVLPVLGIDAIYNGSLRTDAPAWNLHTLDYIIAENIQYVVLAAAWNRNLRDNPEENAIRKGLQKVINILNSHNINVYIVAQVPESRHMYPRELAYRQWKYNTVLGVGPTLNQHLNTKQYSFFDSLAGEFFLLDPTPIFYPQNSDNQIASLNHKPLYIDKDHLSSLGSNQLAPIYNQIVFQDDMEVKK